jgi:hypothetical protein
MTQSTAPYYHWNSRSDWGSPPWNNCSPNLAQINHYCAQTYRGHSLGCHNDRAVVGGNSMSTHAWGAALDFLPDGGNQTGRFVIAPFLIAWSLELGINTIHDYVRQQMWKPNLGWVSASIGSNGGQWLHIETTVTAWPDGRSVEQRIASPSAPPPGAYDPAHQQYGLFPLATKPTLHWLDGWPGSATQSIQHIITYFNDVMNNSCGQHVRDPRGIFTGEEYDNPNTFGSEQGSINALRMLNQFWNPSGSNVELRNESYFGICGPATWKLVDAIATNFGRPR